jgi:predicted DNA-binding transcriptional regulator AlpA
MNGITQALEPNDRLIDARAACDIVGARRRTALYRLIREDRFPTPIHIGRRSLWVESEVRQWVGRKVAESRSAA